MCGITGIISKKQIHNIEERTERMNASINHRGPDAAGVFNYKNKITLGHKRLSIIDVSEAANQPMVSASGLWEIVFNGEIYNFKELKECLNYNFATNSDTEVILAIVEEKGIDWFLQKANGMFAIALFDIKNEITYIIRDRMGIKPLFYFKSKKHFIFSSEIKAILSSGLVDATFNENAVDEYLAIRYIRAPYTFFKNIFQVLPGHYITVDRNLNIKDNTFWQLPSEFNCDSNYNEEEIAEKFEQELVKSIKYRLIADVPLGTYLSGGVDSSLITAITALNNGNNVNTYTIGFPKLNEFEYSQQIADKYKTNHHKIEININDYINNWERLINFKDAPLGVPNEIPLALMSQKLKEKITVVLSGEGADELLGGYGRIFRSPFDFENQKKANNSFYNYFISKYEYVPRVMRDRYLRTSKKYRKYFDNKIIKEFIGKTNEENVFRFFHNYHVKGLLQRVDMTTMQTSVEARVPFLDHNLIEFTYKEIPYELKLRWKNDQLKEKSKILSSDKYSEEYDIPKYLLRKISYKFLPKNIIERKKMGFPVPLTEWFSNLETMALELLPQAQWLNPNMLNDLISRSKNENRAGQILWMFINIELFRVNYFNKNWRW